MSKKNTAKNDTSVIFTLFKTGAIMISCTALSLLIINLLAAYQLGVSILIGVVASIAIIK